VEIGQPVGIHGRPHPADQHPPPRGHQHDQPRVHGLGTLHWYAPLWHEVFNEREPDRSRVLGDLKAWVASRLDSKRA
jgi:alpha-beta hydrolase superfamily lysophospholipase